MAATAALVVGAAVPVLGSTASAAPEGEATATASDALSAVAPVRVLETRAGKPTADGSLAGIGRRGAGSVTQVKVAGRLGVPASASAVVLNVTAVNPSARGNAVVFPCGSDRPVASNLNFTEGQVVANAVFARVGNGGQVCVYTTAATDIVIDLNGWFPASGSLNAVAPVRVLETRAGKPTADGSLAGVGRRGAGSVTRVKVAGRLGVPSSASAVVLNVTAVNPSAQGNAVVYPCGSNRPVASNVNYGPGEVVPNAVVAQVGSGGEVCLYTTSASDYVIDLNGWFPASGTLNAVAPVRVLETRAGKPTADGTLAGIGRRTAGSVTKIKVAGRLGVAGDAEAVVLNVTAVNPSVRGNAVVYPCGADRPVASNVNFLAGDVVPNAVVAGVGSNGEVCVYTTAPTDLVVDLNAWFDGESAAGPGTGGGSGDGDDGDSGDDDEDRPPGPCDGGTEPTVIAPVDDESAEDGPLTVARRIVAADTCEAHAVALADFDGDGLIDLAVPNYGFGGVELWFAQDDGTYAEQALFPWVWGPFAVAAADIDGDGDQDVAAAMFGQDNIEWWRNDGQRVFAQNLVDEPGDAPGAHSIEVIDIDGDGDLDLLTTNQGLDFPGQEVEAGTNTGSVELYRNDGTQNFTRERVGFAAGAQDAVAGDIDGDGDLDIVSASYFDGTVVWHEQRDGAWTERVIDSTAAGAYNVDVADFDGDGRLDVVAAVQLAGEFVVYRNQPAANPGATFVKQVLDDDRASARSVTARDIDGDGRVDVAGASRDDDTVAWYRNTGIAGGAATFERQILSTELNGAYGVTVGDIDGDGDNDIVATSVFDDTVDLFENVTGQPQPAPAGAAADQ